MEDLKKGKYVYYRAIGAKGIPYVKEEELERQFGEALKKLRFDDDVLDWVCTALQNASQTYIEEGIQLLELAQNAGFLFVKQSAHKKRRLLNFLVSNYIWKDGLLTVQFKQPFDMLSEFLSDLNSAEVPEGANNAVFEKWLPEQDSNLRPID